MKKEVLAYYELHYKYLLDNFSNMSADDIYKYLWIKYLNFGVCFCISQLFRVATDNQVKWLKAHKANTDDYWGIIPLDVMDNKAEMLKCLELRINILKTLV